MKRYGWIKIVGVIFLSVLASPAFAQSAPSLSLSLTTGGAPTEMATGVKLLIFLTLLSLAPAILLTMTSFTRIVVVLSFLRQAIGVHQSPPNQVVIGLALFLTFFLMSPVLTEIKDQAMLPYFEETIGYEDAFAKAATPLKKFMFEQTRKADLELMLSFTKDERPQSVEDLAFTVAVPAFVLSELKSAFEIGFLIYLPFVLIDMVVAMVLLTMGMMVLPPVMISLPFKLMLFVLVDGWNLIVGSLMRGYQL